MSVHFQCEGIWCSTNTARYSDLHGEGMLVLLVDVCTGCVCNTNYSELLAVSFLIDGRRKEHLVKNWTLSCYCHRQHLSVLFAAKSKYTHFCSV